ncbi:Chemotaxis protein CheV [Minicystis rosea]|nr:Chemotaxis protein CheV [Minicystis rosea]
MSSAPSHHEPPLVLVVDDFEDNREMFAEYLELSGFQVAQAGTGRDAVTCALALVPDVVLMDLSLPELDGWEATRILKSDPRTSHVPVIALTGHTLAEHSREAKDAGCDAFLTKPCLPEALVEEVERQLARTSAPPPDPGVPDFPAPKGGGKPE